MSKLDLRCINFKYAKMKGCQLLGANLSKCNMERVDLSNAKLDAAQLLGVRMVCSNLEKASLQNCNFEDPAGSVALMEGWLITPSRTPRISGLKSQILKPTFLS